MAAACQYVIEGLSCILEAQPGDRRLEMRDASSQVSASPKGPPMSVCTQPGWNDRRRSTGFSGLLRITGHDHVQRRF